MTRQELQKAFEIASDKPLLGAIAKQRALEATPTFFLRIEDQNKPLQLLPPLREKLTKSVTCSDVSFSLGWNTWLDENTAIAKHLTRDLHTASLSDQYPNANDGVRCSRTSCWLSDPTLFPKCDPFTLFIGVALPGEQKHESTL